MWATGSPLPPPPKNHQPQVGQNHREGLYYQSYRLEVLLPQSTRGCTTDRVMGHVASNPMPSLARSYRNRFYVPCGETAVLGQALLPPPPPPPPPLEPG